MHGGLSAIAEAERQASLDAGDANEDAEYEEGEDSEVDQGTKEELERGMEVKSGFLIKKQERRKVRAALGDGVALTADLEEEVVCSPRHKARILQGQQGR